MWKFLFLLSALVDAVSLKTRMSSTVSGAESDTLQDIAKFLGIQEVSIPAECKENLKQIATKMKEQSWIAKLYYSSWFWTIIAAVMGLPLLVRKLVPRWLRWIFYFCFFTASTVMVIINIPFIRRPVLKMLQAEEEKGSGCTASS